MTLQTTMTTTGCHRLYDLMRNASRELALARVCLGLIGSTYYQENDMPDANKTLAEIESLVDYVLCELWPGRRTERASADDDDDDVTITLNLRVKLPLDAGCRCNRLSSAVDDVTKKALRCEFGIGLTSMLTYLNQAQCMLMT